MGIDHRFIDGYQAATIAKIFRGYLEDQPRSTRSLTPTEKGAQAAPQPALRSQGKEQAPAANRSDGIS